MTQSSDIAKSVGIIGYGKMGKIRALALEEDGRACVTRVYEPYPAEDERYPVAETAQSIIEDPSIGSVFVCGTNDLSQPLTVAALRAGKNVFCEKPPAFTAFQLGEVVDAERTSGKVLMYGFNHRHHGGVRKMKEVVASGVYGRVLWMRGRYGKSVDEDYLRSWRADVSRAGGGILLDQGIHMLDLFLYMTGVEFDEVHAFVSSRYWNIPGIEDNVFAILRNRGTGIEVSFHSTMTQWRHLFSLEIFLERGYLVLNGLKTSSGSYGEEELSIARNRSQAPAASWESEQKLHYRVDTSWRSEAEHFMDAVTLGMPITYGTSEQAMKVMNLVERIYANDHRVGEILHEKLQVVGHQSTPRGQGSMPSRGGN